MRLLSRMSFAFAALFLVASHASATTINFDALNASPSGVSGAPLAAYLLPYGVTYSYTGDPSFLTAALYAMDDDNIYGGGVVQASSGDNLLVSSGNGARPGSYRLFFNTGQDYVSFTRAASLVSSSFPMWSVTAYDAGMNVVDTDGESFMGGIFAAKTFTLGTPGDSVVDITSVLFSYNGFGVAGFDSPLIDDIVLPNEVAQMPEPASLVLLGSGLAGVLHRRRRKSVRK